jgi:SLT domain-containing protein
MIENKTLFTIAAATGSIATTVDQVQVYIDKTLGQVPVLNILGANEIGVALGILTGFGIAKILKEKGESNAPELIIPNDMGRYTLSSHLTRDEIDTLIKQLNEEGQSGSVITYSDSLEPDSEVVTECFADGTVNLRERNWNNPGETYGGATRG